MKRYIKSTNVSAFDNPFKKMKDAKNQMKDTAKSAKNDVDDIKKQMDEFKKLQNIKSSSDTDIITADCVEIGDVITLAADKDGVPAGTSIEVTDVLENTTGYVTPDISVVIRCNVLSPDTESLELYYDEDEVVGTLIGADIEASTTVDAGTAGMDTSATLLDELEKAARNYMMNTAGFNRAEAFEYSEVYVYQEQDGRYCARVQAELSYDGMMDLLAVLDPIVAKYDKYAYFDMDEPGIASAYLDI